MRRDLRSGFTLFEALAAMVALGFLAAATVPLLRHLGRFTSSERLLAQGYLRTMAPPTDPAIATIQAIDGHPGWNLTITKLIAEPEPPAQPGARPAASPPHHWLLMRIMAKDGGEKLADALVVVMDPGALP